MAIELKRADGKYWVNEQGQPVPIENIDPLDRDEDRHVTQIIKKAARAEERLAKLKAEIHRRIEKHQIKVAQEYVGREIDMDSSTTLKSFDGMSKVEVKIKRIQSADNRIDVARKLIGEYLEAEMEGVKPSLRAIIEQKMKLDGNGQVSIREMQSLRSLRIKHPTWKQAMDIIADSISVSHTKKYIRIMKRDEQGQYQSFNLSLASVPPYEKPAKKDKK